MFWPSASATKLGKPLANVTEYALNALLIASEAQHGSFAAQRPAYNTHPLSRCPIPRSLVFAAASTAFGPGLLE